MNIPFLSVPGDFIILKIKLPASDQPFNFVSLRNKDSVHVGVCGFRGKCVGKHSLQSIRCPIIADEKRSKAIEKQKRLLPNVIDSKIKERIYEELDHLGKNKDVFIFRNAEHLDEGCSGGPLIIFDKIPYCTGIFTARKPNELYKIYEWQTQHPAVMQHTVEIAVRCQCVFEAIHNKDKELSKILFGEVTTNLNNAQSVEKEG